MPLAAGSRLGPYEVLAKLGEGGMGEVYRARDTRLDRTVAIKVLPAHIAGDPEFRQRFEREARTISQLSHPNICTLHDVGEHDGQTFLVLEYLEGETLAERLKKGPLSIEQALGCAIQMADALDKAHRQGIVHRDLKPGNIFLVRSGGASAAPIAKLLDFGLAKSGAGHGGAALQGRGSGAESTGGTADLTAPPTVTTPLTAQGTILGTFQYMAPEQIEGQEADARTDIFAFGCVLYEMVTGKRAFEGKTQISLISAILSTEPRPIPTLQPMAPRALDRFIRICLAKDPEQRWTSAHDVLLQLEAMADEPAAESAATAARKRGLPVPALAAAVVLTAGVAGGAGWLLRPEPVPASPVARFSIALPADQGFTRAGRQVVAISPDGRRIVYVANQQLFLRSLDEPDAVPLRGTAIDPANPFFSPDGEWIAFWAGGALRKIAVTGGAPVTLCQADIIRGGSWNADGILFGAADGVYRVAPEGGAPERLVGIDSAARHAVQGPQLVPGNVLLFTRREDGAWDDAKAVVRNLDTGEERVVLEGGTDFRYVPTGHLLYGREQTIFAVPFDPAALQVKGGPAALVEQVNANDIIGATHFATSGTGTLVYVPGGWLDARLVWVDRQGVESPAAEMIRPFEDLSLAPDGRAVAVTLMGASYSVWVLDLARGTLTRLTFGADERDPLWGCDGKHIIYDSLRDGVSELFQRPADGSGEESAAVAPAGTSTSAGSCSPDGRWLTFTRGGDIWVMPLYGERTVRRLFETPFRESFPEISPDGRWMAYVSNESGRNEIYVRPFLEGSGKWQISTDTGDDPLWAPNGSELFYRSGDRVVAVPIDTTSGFKPGVPSVLFEGRYRQTGRDYGISPDGRRFLMIRSSAGNTTATLHVVLNWFEDLKARVPVR